MVLIPVAAVCPATGQENSLLKNAKVSIDLGFGLPYAWAIPEETGKKIKIDQTELTFKSNPNVGLGVILGYSFPFRNTFRLDPEIGLTYGFTRKLQVPALGITFEEDYLQIPVGIKFSRAYEGDFYFAHGYMLGYEFNVLLSSTYKQGGSHLQLPASFQGNKDLKEAIADLPKLSGNIFLGGYFDFPKGFYLGARFEFPIELFKLKATQNNGETFSNTQLDKKFIYPLRALNASLVEINVGVNIMKWLCGEPS